MPRVSINIATWNSMKFLPSALESIFAQRYRDFSVLIIDNASSDGTIRFVQENYPQVAILRNTRNHGFARAHNQGFTYAQAHLKPEGGDPLVLVTNHDVVLEPDFLGNLVAEIDHRPDAGSAGGRVLKAAVREEFGQCRIERTETIDTTGLLAFRSGRFADRGSGMSNDSGKFRNPGEVFGISGCLVLHRLKALEDAAYSDGTVYDEDYFMYKEDVDLAWRLRLLGWGAAYAPDAVAYHVRTAVGGERPNPLQVVRGRKSRSYLVNRLSARNHLMTMLKNAQWGNIIRYFPLIALYELQKIGYSVFFEPKTFLAGLSVLPKLPKIMSRRRQVMGRVRSTARDIRKWY